MIRAHTANLGFICDLQQKLVFGGLSTYIFSHNGHELIVKRGEVVIRRVTVPVPADEEVLEISIKKFVCSGKIISNILSKF